ncbi:MAG: hypothetical protein ABSD69_00405 [Candidatus Levyibacteriota bacterium]
MIDETVDSGSKPNPKEQAEIQQRINDLGKRARSIIQANDLLKAFGIMDLTDLAQKRRALLVEIFIAEQLAVDALGRRLSRRSTIVSEQVLESVVVQNRHYLAHPEDYPGAGNIKFAVQTLFEMVHERTGKSIDPEIPIDKRADPPAERIIPKWKERFS